MHFFGRVCGCRLITRCEIAAVLIRRWPSPSTLLGEMLSPIGNFRSSGVTFDSGLSSSHFLHSASVDASICDPEKISSWRTFFSYAKTLVLSWDCDPSEIHYILVRLKWEEWWMSDVTMCYQIGDYKCWKEIFPTFKCKRY